MTRYFDEELLELNKKILEMSGEVENAIGLSVRALRELSRKLAEAVIKGDKHIDNMELEIEEKCLNIIALYQPAAADLRFVVMSLKITTDLERIADLAVDIAQRVLELADQPLLKPLIDIPKLATLAQGMVRDAINSFVNKDTELARSVILRDNEADELRNLVQSELINDYMVKDGSTAPRAIPLLLVARHLERICDHATNIAEDVIYMVKAEVVRHRPESLK
ncbi:MAG TPA: phosphate signaling complex protein PhoU [Candidatus Saccharicenans sp.]|jgi:phosphate transport system protein|nr:phosphate signaling complex protein PhoU [Candidatus Saccharicenans sp.]HPB59265.1 phosphate signaling complex protein PhoU [Candidatus Saccharicenans sp.]HQO75798.1 phosphate signaling complex protein PhoU [Candidatus Saccharicenans sp.]HUM79424.1 phosphate signaling complex protein PhoU [Candidatus Saccharicenans sp.]